MKTKWLIIGLVACLYIGFRVWNLTTSCIWFDEIFGVHAAQHGWSELFGFVAQDLIHPPLFYLLLKIWIIAGGDSLLWLRIFPVLMACLALVPLLLLCRELKFSAFETATVVLFLAVNGSLIKYAQEIRMYSLLFCLTCFSLWLFTRWVYQAGSSAGSSVAPLFIVNLLLIYTHYFGGLIVLTELVIVLWLRRDKAMNWLIMSGLWILSFLPWAYAVVSAYRQNAGLGQNLNWAGRPGLLQLLQFLAALHQPFYFQQSNGEPWVSVFAIPVVLLCITAIVFLFASVKNAEPAWKILLLFCSAPLVIAFLVSWLSPFSIWGNRHLTMIFVPYFLLMAMGLNRIQPRAVRSLCYGVLVGFFIPALIINYSRAQTIYPWCSWEPLAAQVKETDATTFYVFEDAIAYELWYALEQKAAGKFHVVLIEDDREVWEDKAYFLPRGFYDIEKASEDSIAGDKFWIVVRDIANKPDTSTYSLWKKLEAKGYKTGEALSFNADRATAYFVPVERVMIND